MPQRKLAALISSGVALFALGSLGCQSEQPRQHSQQHRTSDGLSDTDSANMAAEDADSLKLKQSETEPARRPPPTRERRPVDQPRIRG